MSAITEFSRIMDLPPSGLLFEEVRKKLIKTYVIMNDTPVYLLSIDEDYSLEYIEREGIESTVQCDDVHTIEVFMPPSGIYNTERGTMYLWKTGDRQWRKSFCNDIYRYQYLPHSPPLPDTLRIVNLIHRSAPPSDWALSKDTIFLFNKKVATFSDGNMTLLAHDLEDDVFNFMRSVGYEQEL